jgi:hypothetical protein
MTLLAEDLLLLVLDDETGAQTLDGTRTDLALGGALLLELALAGRVELTKDGPWWARERVGVTDPAPLGDALLDEALVTVAEKPRGSQELVGRLGKGVRARLLDRLQARGVLERRSDTVLGLFPRTRWPTADSRHEEQVRARLRDVLLVGCPRRADREPSPRSWSRWTRPTPCCRAQPGGTSSGQGPCQDRGRGRLGCGGRQRAVAAMQAAVMAGTVAATTAATASSW